MGYAEASRGKFVTPGIHFIGDLQDGHFRFFFFRCVLPLVDDVAHFFLNRKGAFQYGLFVKISRLGRKVGRIKLRRVIHLVVGDSIGHHHIGHRMSPGKHIFDFLAGIDVPVRHLMLSHQILLFLGQAFSLSDLFHDGKGIPVGQSLEPQVIHDVVPGGNGIVHGSRAADNQVLGVVEPYVRPMGKTRNPHQIGKLVRLRVIQHFSGKAGAKFRNPVAAVGKTVIRILDVQPVNAVENAVDPFIPQRHLQGIHARHVLQMANHGRHIVSQDVQLQQVLVDGVIVKVGRDDIGLHIVGRMLHRAELVDFMTPGHDDDATGVLPRSFPHPFTATGKPVRLELVDGELTLFKVFHHIAISRFALDGADGPGFVYVFRTKDFIYEFVRRRLVFACEIQVDVRLFVRFKSQERLKGNGKPLLVVLGAADRAFFRRHVHAAVVFLLVAPLQVLALGAEVMGFQRIYFCDARHGSHEGGTYGTPGAYQVPVLHGFLHQHFRRHVHDGISVVDNGVQLLVQPRPNFRRHWIAVHLDHPLFALFPEDLV